LNINNYISQTALINNKTVLVGFDGFIDALFKIKRELHGENSVYFDKIHSFGDYVQKKDTSFCLDLDEVKTKIGGNAPIMANALGSLGLKTNLIAALGFPEVNPYFKSMSENCQLYSVSEPGKASIYEFEDGKIMFSNCSVLNDLNWTLLKEVIGLPVLIQLFKSNDLFCLLNWSEIKGTTSILKGILTEVFPEMNLENKTIFFDLSDFSNRDKKEVETVIELINEFAKHTKVVLSLNKNESQTLHDILFETTENNFYELGKKIYKKLPIAILVIHNAKETHVFENDLEVKASPELITNPMISTGAGDHFNAGFCYGLLANLELKECLVFANSVASYYIKTGVSPNINNLIK